MSLLNKILFLVISIFTLVGLWISCQSESSQSEIVKHQESASIQAASAAEQEASIPTSVPVSAIGKRSHPDSIRPPIITSALPPKTTLAHPNRQIAKKGIVIPIQKDKLQKIIPTEDSSIIVRPIVVEVEKVPAIHRSLTPASPPRFKDKAVYDIRYLEVEQGLNCNYQTTVCQTRSGYLWFGATPNGICRYDGKSFLQFTEKEGLVYDDINDIIEDRQQNLWIGTLKGLSK